MWYTGIYVNGSQLIMPTGAVELAWDAVQFKVVCHIVN